jgi:signal peptidase I
VTPDPPRPDDSSRLPDDLSPEERADALSDDVIRDIGDSGPETGDPFAAGAAETREAIERLRAEATERGEKEDATRSFWRELPILILVALVVAVLIKTFLVQAFYIPSGSMEDTLVVGDRVMVNKLSYVFGSPDHGDVVVFDNPSHEGGSESLLSALVRHVGESLGISSPDSALIKRVIAVGGETIEIRDNRVLVDGTAIDEPYIGDDARMRDFGPTDVPEGYVFVMGDNRAPGGSHDSRAFGPVPEDDIVGRAFVIVWPASRWSGL